VGMGMSGILNQFLIGEEGSGVNNYFFTTPVYFKSLTGKALDCREIIVRGLSSGWRLPKY
jgi:hypothetical protein